MLPWRHRHQGRDGIEEGRLAIVECNSCGATWSMLGDRLRVLDFSPIGGPQVQVILPKSYPNLC